MAQVTIYLPNDLESRIKAMAGSLDLSISKLITTLLEQKVRNEWSPDIRELAGAWGEDFPSREEIGAGEGRDVPREAF